jgi:hypothetical protein
VLHGKPNETPPLPNCTPPDFRFDSFDRRNIEVSFEGGGLQGHTEINRRLGLKIYRDQANRPLVFSIKSLSRMALN